MSRDHKLIFQGTSKQLNYVGGGRDGKEDYIIDCHQGETVYVTEEKKAELLRDHPEWFVEANLEPPEKAAPVDYEIPDEPAEIATWKEPEPDYDSMTNAELRDLAGTDNKRLSKKKLIKMIKDKEK